MATNETSIELNRAAPLTLRLVPKVSLVLASPPGDVVSKIANPDALDISVPITGTCANFPPKKYVCKLTWLVLRDGAAAAEAMGSVTGEMTVTGSKFEFKVANLPPKLNLIENRLFNKGKLGFRLVPEFPTADTYELAPCLSFDNPLRVKVTPPSAPAVGTKVIFSPTIATVFQKATVQVNVQELDDSVESIHLAISLQDAWGRADDAVWVIGFADEDATCFDMANANKDGYYEYRWTLRIAADGKAFTDVTAGTDLPKVKQPTLVSFKVMLDEHWYADRLVSKGQITGFAPECGVKVKVRTYSFDQLGKTPAPNLDTNSVTTTLAADGQFEAEMAVNSIWPGGQLPDHKQLFAVLSFMALAKGQPLANVLDYDSLKFPGFEGNNIAFESVARWVSSQEIPKLKLEPLIPSPPSYNVATVSDAQLKQLQAKGADGQRLAATLIRAKASFSELLKTNARLVVTESPGNGKQPVLTIAHQSFNPSKSTRIHIHYHGWNSTVAEPPAEISKTTANITEQFKTDSQTIFILPECKSAPTTATEKMGETNWSNVVSITATMDDGLLGAGFQPKGVSVKERLLTMHSGGGRALGYAVQNTPDGKGVLADIIELQDCMYGASSGLSCLAGLKKWVLTTNGKAVKSVIYYEGTGGNTQKPDDELKKALGAKYTTKVFGDHYQPLTKTFIHPPVK